MSHCANVNKPMKTHEPSKPPEAAVGSMPWVGISARTKAQIQQAAEMEGLTVTKARWERVRKGGIMCGPKGGWMVVVRGGPKMHEDVAMGLTLAELYDDLLRCGRSLRYLGWQPRAGMPTDGTELRAPEKKL